MSGVLAVPPPVEAISSPTTFARLADVAVHSFGCAFILLLMTSPLSSWEHNARIHFQIDGSAGAWALGALGVVSALILLGQCTKQRAFASWMLPMAFFAALVSGSYSILGADGMIDGYRDWLICVAAFSGFTFALWCVMGSTTLFNASIYLLGWAFIQDVTRLGFRNAGKVHSIEHLRYWELLVGFAVVVAVGVTTWRRRRGEALFGPTREIRFRFCAIGLLGLAALFLILDPTREIRPASVKLAGRLLGCLFLAAGWVVAGWRALQEEEKRLFLFESLLGAAVCVGWLAFQLSLRQSTASFKNSVELSLLLSAPFMFWRAVLLIAVTPQSRAARLLAMQAWVMAFVFWTAWS